MARRSSFRRRARSARWNRYDDWGFPAYVPASERKAQAEQTLRSLRQSGREVSPVSIEGRKIAETFWGCSWCDNLERYSDFANRLPRGRTYVRNGSVIDLQIGAGRVDAMVSGSEVYTVTVDVSSVTPKQWRAICDRCAGGIDSVVELLQGRFSQGVMAHLCAQGTGLFPTPPEIRFTCSCPDSAYMCKHVAAVLYGIGARLDQRPELLFRLRQVNEQDLIATAGTAAPLSHKAPASSRILDDSDLAEMFGVVFAPEVAAPAGEAPPAVGRSPRTTAARKPRTKTTATAPKASHGKEAAAAQPKMRAGKVPTTPQETRAAKATTVPPKFHAGKEAAEATKTRVADKPPVPARTRRSR